MITKTCPICNMNFKIHKSNNRKYCSVKYSDKGHIGLLSGDKNPSKRLKVRKKMGISQKERFKDITNHPNYGKSFSEETIKNMSNGQRKRFGPPIICIDCGKKIRRTKFNRCNICYNKWAVGKNNPKYKDKKKHKVRLRDIEKGYSSLFTVGLKLEIFERDGFTCEICKKRGGILHCHHIDYNKLNNGRNNLITLCNRCHAKTNFNRDKWKKYFNKPPKTWTLLLGRYQCFPHKGHQGLVRELLKEGKNVCIAIREYDKSEKNPYSYYERLKWWESLFQKEILDGKVIICPLPDIETVAYGRTPGWNIKEIKLDKKTESISATKKRGESK